MIDQSEIEHELCTYGAVVPISFVPCDTELGNQGKYVKIKEKKKTVNKYWHDQIFYYYN